MKIEGWKCYKNAAIPLTPPHINPNTKPIEDRTIWNMDNKPQIVRWTTNFDCGYETQWWYCIKDNPLDVDALSSKKRYEINKGKKNFEVKKIDPAHYWEEMYDVTIKAFANRPDKIGITPDKMKFKEHVERWQYPIVVIAAFSREDGRMSGFSFLIENDTFVDFSMLRVTPNYEKLAVNAAIVGGICDYYKDRLSAGDGFYISDGARNILHQTAFQDYLEKYFSFKKAYCHLHIKYRKDIELIVKILMPLRKILYKLEKNSLARKIAGILKMEEISRSFNEKE